MRFGLGQFTLQIPPWDPRDHAALYADTLALAETADRAGLESFWLAEHHGASDGYIPSTLAFLAAVAARTERIEVGTGVLLSPFHDPVRLAEDAAVVDNISGGRLNLGLGLGWAPEEYRMFGVETKGRGKRLQELVEVLKLAWTKDRFSFEGSILRFDDTSITPKPKRTPPVWLGGGTPAAIERAALIADGHFPASVGGLGSSVERAREILEIRASHGVTGPYRYGMFVPVGIGRDGDDGWAKIRDGVLHVRGSYALWGQGVRDVSGARDVAAEWEDAVRATAICGSPDEIVEQLRGPLGEIDRMGFADCFFSAILAPPGTPRDLAEEQVEIYATKIAPALRLQ